MSTFRGSGPLESTGLPRRYAVTDMAYYPQSKVESYQIPMREQGWKLVGDTPNRTESKGVAAAYRGAVIVDGQAYCPAMKNRRDLLDPKGKLDRGEITEEQFEMAIEQRRRFQLDTKETTKDGDVRFACPALRGKVMCPLRKNDEQARKAMERRGKRGLPALPIRPTQAPKANACGDICKKKSVTINLHEDDAKRVNKYLQQGPAAYTDEWNALYKAYRARNEGANAYIKSNTDIGIGDRTKQGIRGFTGVAVRTVVAVVVANVRLFMNAEKRARDTKPTPPPNPSGRPPKTKQAIDFIELAGPNAPPVPQRRAA